MEILILPLLYRSELVVWNLDGGRFTNPFSKKNPIHCEPTHIFLVLLINEVRPLDFRSSRENLKMLSNDLKTTHNNCPKFMSS